MFTRILRNFTRRVEILDYGHSDNDPVSQVAPVKDILLASSYLKLIYYTAFMMRLIMSVFSEIRTRT